MRIFSKKVPKNTADIQALRDKFNKFDDKERDELAEQIKYEIAGSNLKVAVFAFLGGVAFGVFVYIGITHEWFSRYFFDRFGIDTIKRCLERNLRCPRLNNTLYGCVFCTLCGMVLFWLAKWGQKEKSWCHKWANHTKSPWQTLKAFEMSLKIQNFCLKVDISLRSIWQGSFLKSISKDMFSFRLRLATH